MSTETLAAVEAVEHRSPAPRGPKWAVALAIAFGCALTLAMQGYQFGKSNHTVYLIDALRHVHPELLQNDWFATKTLQYHAAFGWMTRGLMRMGIVEPAFFAGYLALVVLLHWAWWRVVRALGGGAGVFILSEVFFHASAGGTGLGMYQFLQDGAFLPSNIAAVALLWGLVFWIEQRRVAAGICFGLAGLFHLNYALVGVTVWMLLVVCKVHRSPPRRAPGAGTAGAGASGGGGPKELGLFGLTLDRRTLLASAAAVIPSVVNIALALRTTAAKSGSMALAEFVDLYVRLRHPHHYDPSSWPAWLWLAFLWPTPLAVWAWVRKRDGKWGDGEMTYAWLESAKIAFIFALILLVALIGAGLAFTSEPLIQASLYRFSIFPKLLACIGAAFVVMKLAAARERLAAAVAGAAVAAGLGIIAICIVRGPYLGMFRIPDDDPAYVTTCDWIATNTPADAVFIVPPSEQAFRLHARRAIVINFKGVPQLSGELGEWRDRLAAVLDLPDLRSLPRPFGATLTAMRERYDALPPEHFRQVARRYGARYVLVGKSWGEAWEPRRVNGPESGAWFLYDLGGEQGN